MAFAVCCLQTTISSSTVCLINVNVQLQSLCFGTSYRLINLYKSHALVGMLAQLHS